MPAELVPTGNELEFRVRTARANGGVQNRRRSVQLHAGCIQIAPAAHLIGLHRTAKKLGRPSGRPNNTNQLQKDQHLYSDKSHIRKFTDSN